MNNLKMLAALVAAGGLAACSNGSGAVEPPVTSVNVGSTSYSHLQFAVGTANIAGSIGLNTVVTLRQSNGLSAVGYSTPTITWDGNFVNPGSAAKVGADAGAKQISGVLPANPAGTTVSKSTLGSGANSWGAFGYGLNPSNSSTSGSPTTIAQTCLPFFPTFVTAPNFSGGSDTCPGGQAQFFGGPPAFPQVRSAALAGQLGAFLGFVPFAGMIPAPNSSGSVSNFSLSVAIPTTTVTTLPTVTTTMKSFTPLPLFATPTLTPDGAGGGTLTYALPAGVTEAYLIVVNVGPDPANGSPNCNYGGSPPFYYTVEVTGGTSVGLGGAGNPGDNLSATPAVGTMPLGKTTHTFCSAADNAAAAAQGVPVTNGGNPVTGVANSAADQYQIVGVGFDYPAFESAYPQSNGNPTPTITGANGQADLTISDLSPFLVY